ncbi:hypothetical protein AMECASPLE_002375 [Ameca splendens]|uniref:Uncharacterized protein n=1 Tax=Ameca splendens TaxID=208324 RepID=A0ABV0YWA7_9TELE
MPSDTNNQCMNEEVGEAKAEASVQIHLIQVKWFSWVKPLFLFSIGEPTHWTAQQLPMLQRKASIQSHIILYISLSTVDASGSFVNQNVASNVNIFSRLKSAIQPLSIKL